MAERSIVVFPPFRLDLGQEQLWRGSELVPLRPKSFAVLRCLVAQVGQLVSRESLLQTVWAETQVSQSVLRASVREVRQALGDTVAAPRYIETVPRRGWRFLVTPQISQTDHLVDYAGSREGVFSSPHTVVGRETELARLHAQLKRVLAGERQVAFLSGEPGIGKTTLVDTFLEQVAARTSCLVIRGHCVEQYGAGEAYLPLFDGLHELCRSPAEPERTGRTQPIGLLRQHAPMWLAQLPGLLTSPDREALQRDIGAASASRMVRELGDFLAALSSEYGTILVLEDLHWSDVATLDLVSYLTRRYNLERFFIVATYRSGQVPATSSPFLNLIQETPRDPQAQEYVLGGLCTDAIAAYLVTRFPDHAFPPQLAAALTERTGGNPLFLVNVLTELLQQRIIQSTSRSIDETADRWQLRRPLSTVLTVVPENLRWAVARHMQHLSVEEQQLLEAASLVGRNFAVATVAAVLGHSLGHIVQLSETLEQRQLFIQAAGIVRWPDGTLTPRYRFLHPLYQQLWYEHIPVPVRRGWHQQAGERLEAAYQPQPETVAAELAVHFEQAQDVSRAVQYRQHAGHNAMQRYAYQEVLTHFTAGLELLTMLPHTPDQLRIRLGLNLGLIPPLLATQGLGAPQLETVYLQARHTSQEIGDSGQLCEVLRGLWLLYATRAELDKAGRIATELSDLAQHTQDSLAMIAGQMALGMTASFCGDWHAARPTLNQAFDAYQAEPSHRQMDAMFVGGFFFHLSLAQLLSGFPDQASAMTQHITQVAEDTPHPFILAAGAYGKAMLSQLRGDTQTTLLEAETALALATEYDLSEARAISMILCGWALAMGEHSHDGIAQLKDGLAAYHATGAAVYRPYFGVLLAEAYGRAGQVQVGLEAVEEALASIRHTQERFAEAELHRLKGELLLQATRSRSAEAEACFVYALELAQHQAAKWWELRAAVSVGRLWSAQGKPDEARHVLTQVYTGLSEGFTLPDVQTANALLHGNAV